ncbi:hypothetical protein LOZ58_004367 [Ophidiomyces ophidiicola]|nr:hypothetical protein LOZ65_004504 [Ophidiomyces ophidiicola]KAI1939374.1 hypothetical protein LOZ66_002686 [Ophidiomyces ophidiicola]KAI1959558.1 hypothetical protein LOZ58_004367 [Ophidiomyces ophidiicola]
MASSPGSHKPYVSRGQVLPSPPLTVRIGNFIYSIYAILGLYFVSLFSLDPYSAAQNSRFNVVSPPSRNIRGTRPSWGGAGGGPPGGGGGGGGGGGSWGWGSGTGGGGTDGPSKRIGRVDDVRGPECRSCG